MVAVPLAAVVVVSLACPAGADDGWDTVDCGQHPYPGCELGVGHSPGGSGADDEPDGLDERGESGDSVSGGQQEGPACRNVPVDYEDPAEQPKGAGGWFFVLCSPEGKDPWSHGPVWIPADGGTQPVSPAEVALTARERLSLPKPDIAASPRADQLVNLPTWLWLDRGWVTVSATASVPGVSVTATARPRWVEWSMGDGGTVACRGAGTLFGRDANPRTSSPDCGYTYRRSSAAEPGQTFFVSATVRWSVTWTGGGESGTFPDLTTTGTARFRVAESQALNTRPTG